MLAAVVGSTVATWLCGQAESLETLVLWRILQGGIGAPVVPLANAIVLDSFPRRQAGLVSSIFGMTVVLGPVIGPVFGGHAGRDLQLALGLLHDRPGRGAGGAAVAVILPATGPERGADGLDGLPGARHRHRLPAIGLLPRAAAGLAGSPEIIAEIGIAALAFYVFLAHSLTTDRPFLNLRLLLDRNYALGLVLVLIYGMVNFTPIVLLPTLLQSYAGYPDSIIGQIVGYRGIGGVIGFGSTLLIGRWDPRIGMTIGFGAAGGLGALADEPRPQCRRRHAAAERGAAGRGRRDHLGAADGADLPHPGQPLHRRGDVAVPPAAEPGIEPVHLAQRDRDRPSTTMNYSRMTELVSPYNRALSVPGLMGGWSTETLQGLARLSKEIDRQAAMIGYLNAFGLYMAASAIAILFVLLAKGKPRAAPG